MKNKEKSLKKIIFFLLIILTIVLFVNGIYIYTSFNRKSILIIRSCDIENNIMQYLKQIEISLSEENEEDVQHNMELLRYECQLMDCTLKELWFLCKPFHKFAYTKTFIDWYQDNLIVEVKNKNVEIIKMYILYYSDLEKNLDNIELEKMSISKLMFYYDFLEYY